MKVFKAILWAFLAVFPVVRATADSCWLWDQPKVPNEFPEEEEISFVRRPKFVDDTLPLVLIDKMIKEGFSLSKLTVALNGTLINEQFVGAARATVNPNKKPSDANEVYLFRTHYALWFDGVDLSVASRESMPNTYLRELLQPQEERTGALAGRLYRPKEPVLDRPSIVGQSDLTTFLNERMPVGWFYVVNFELTGAPQATVSEEF